MLHHVIPIPESKAVVTFPVPQFRDIYNPDREFLNALVFQTREIRIAI